MHKRAVEARDAAPTSLGKCNEDGNGRYKIDELSDNRNAIKPYGHDKDYCAFIYYSCPAYLAQQLICPFCKSVDVRVSILEGKKCGLAQKWPFLVALLLIL